MFTNRMDEVTASLYGNEKAFEEMKNEKTAIFNSISARHAALTELLDSLNKTESVEPLSILDSDDTKWEATQKAIDSSLDEIDRMLDDLLCDL